MSDEPDSAVRSVKRRAARRENVSYGDTVTLHESNRQRQTMVPFFVDRSSGTQVTVKLQTFTKSGPHGLVLDEEKSLSLNEGAARRLHQALGAHFAVAEESEGDGEYLVIRVDDGAARVEDHDPADVAKALSGVLGRPEIASHLAGADLSEALVTAMSSAIRLSEMRDAVGTLRQHLSAGTTDEATYQAWCEAHAWAFGNAFVMRDEVRDISAGDSIDVMLPTVMSGHRDIVELKRPDMSVLRYDTSHRNWYWASEVTKAIGQCHRYLDVLHENAAKGLLDHPEVVAYHPRAIVVIGRSHDWDDDWQKALRGLNARLSGIQIMTYDHLLAQGERLLQMVDGAAPGGVEAPADDPSPRSGVGASWVSDDDLPW